MTGSSVSGNVATIPIVISNLAVSYNSSNTQKLRVAGSGGSEGGAFTLAAGGALEFTSGAATDSSGADTTIKRDSAGVIRINDHVRTSKVITVVQTLTIADNGNGATRATATLTPTSSYVTCSCGDPQGCDVAVSETGAVDGQSLRIVAISTNPCGFADTAGVTEIAGAVDLGQNDALSYLYVTDRWVEISRSNN